MPSHQTESMLSATDRLKLAHEFLDGAKWKLIFSRGSGKSVNGMKTRVRIYAAGCSVNALHEVQQLLSEEKPVQDPMIDGAALTGTYYHRTSWWTGKIGAPMSVTPGTVSIVRELTDDINLQNTNTVEDDCGNTTTIRFVWDAETIEDVTTVEHSGDQGYQVKIGGVNRDPETGFYSYYVTTTQRKYLHLPEHVVGEDAFSKEYAEAWLGMYGTIASPTDEDGTAISVLDPDTFVAGTSKSVSWRRNNDDCTLDAEGRKKVAKTNVVVGTGCDKDLFKEVDSTETAAQAAVLLHAPAATGGLKVAHKSDLRADGLFNNRVVNDQELKVVDSRKVLASTIFENETALTQTNVPSSEVPALTAAGGGKVYTVQVEKTPGDLRNVAVTEKEEISVASVVVTQEKDLLKSEESVEDIAATALGASPAASAGLITTHVDTKTPGGKYRRRKVTRQSNAKVAWVASKATTSLSVTNSSTDVNAASAIDLTTTAAQGVRVEKVKKSNPDGTFENITQDTTSVPATADSSAGAALVTEDLTVLKNSRSVPVPGPGAQGVVNDVSFNINDDGTFDARKTSRTSLPATADSSAGAALVTEDLTVLKNSRSVPVPGPGAQGVVNDVSFNINDDGTFDARKTIRTSQPGSTGSLGSSNDKFKKETTERKKYTRSPEAAATGGIGGVITDTSNNINDDGTFDAVIRTVTEQSVPVSSKQETMTLYGLRTSITDTQVSSTPVTPTEVGNSAEFTTTPGGLLNVVNTTFDRSSASGRLLTSLKTGDATHNKTVEETFYASNPGHGTHGLVGHVVHTSEIRAHESGGFIRTLTVDTPITNIFEYISKTFTYEEEDYNGTGEDATITLDLYIISFVNAEWSFVVAEAGAFVDPTSINVRWSLNQYWLYSGSLSFEHTSTTLGT